MNVCSSVTVPVKDKKFHTECLHVVNKPSRMYEQTAVEKSISCMYVEQVKMSRLTNIRDCVSNLTFTFHM